MGLQGIYGGREWDMMLRFCFYLFLAALPVFATIIHDAYIGVGRGIELQPLGYYVYNYTPSIFYWIQGTFADTGFTGIISTLMKTSLFTYSFVISSAAAAYVIHAKVNNKGPFRNYLKDIPKLQKKWMNSDALGARFSGGKAHIKPQIHNDNEAA